MSRKLLLILLLVCLPSMASAAKVVMGNENPGITTFTIPFGEMRLGRWVAPSYDIEIDSIETKLWNTGDSVRGVIYTEAANHKVGDLVCSCLTVTVSDDAGAKLYQMDFTDQSPPCSLKADSIYWFGLKTVGSTDAQVYEGDSSQTVTDTTHAWYDLDYNEVYFGAKDSTPTTVHTLGIEDTYRGTFFDAPLNGTIDSIVGKFKESFASATAPVRMAIYDTSDNALIDSTAEFDVDGNTFAWYQRAAVGGAAVSRNGNYSLVAWGGTDGDLNSVWINRESQAVTERNESNTYSGNGWESTWSGYTSASSYIGIIYCVMTETGDPYIPSSFTNHPVNNMRYYNPYNCSPYFRILGDTADTPAGGGQLIIVGP